MLTMCHAEADEDSSDLVARSVILHPVSLAVEVHLPLKSVAATAAFLACHARTFLLLPFLGTKVGSTREHRHKHEARPKPRAKTETSGNVVVCAMMAVRLQEQHNSCSGSWTGEALDEGLCEEMSWEQTWNRHEVVYRECVTGRWTASSVKKRCHTVDKEDERYVVWIGSVGLERVREPVNHMCTWLRWSNRRCMRDLRRLSRTRC